MIIDSQQVIKGDKETIEERAREKGENDTDTVKSTYLICVVLQFKYLSINVSLYRYIIIVIMILCLYTARDYLK